MDTDVHFLPSRRAVDFFLAVAGRVVMHPLLFDLFPHATRALHMKIFSIRPAAHSARAIGAVLSLTLLAAGGWTPALADDGIDHSYFSPMVSYVIADDDRTTDDAFGGILAIGRRFSPFFGAELRGSYLDYGDTDETGPLCASLNIGCTRHSVSLTTGGLGLNFYPTGGGLYLHADAMGGDHGQYHAGLGYEFGNLIAGLALRAEALYLNSDSFGETRFNVGLSIPFGSKPSRPLAPLPTPSPEPRVVPPPPCVMPEPGEPLSLTGCKINDSIVLEGLEFEIDSAEIRSDEQQALDRSTTALKDRPEINIEVRGHTDSTASTEYNQGLSERRAESVKTYLVDDGIARERITTRGFGELQPIADNETVEGRARNRRVELAITGRSTRPTVSPTPAPDAVEDDVGTPILLAPEPTAAAPVPITPEPDFEIEPAFGSDTPQPSGDVTVIKIEGFSYSPQAITVKVGTTVEWRNADTNGTHTVTFDQDDSGRMPGGAVYRMTFDEPGGYPYRCSLHPAMTGTVIVTDR